MTYNGNAFLARNMTQWVGVVAACNNCNTVGSDVWFVTDGMSAFATNAATIWTAGNSVCMIFSNGGYFSPGTPNCAANQIDVGIITRTDPVASNTHYGLLIRGGHIFNGNTPLYRCTTAGALPVGALTATTGNCGASVDTGLRVR
jgi:hypothetical protein